MKSAIILMVLAVFFIANPISAQENGDDEKRTVEREIKTSGLYLYGEAVGKDKSEATKLAKSMLVAEINKEALNHPEWQLAKTIKAEGVEYTADLIDMPRGNKTRVIAYLKKENIQAVFAENVPKVKLSDKKGENKKEKAKREEPEKAIDADLLMTGNEKSEPTGADDSRGEQSELLKSIVNATSASEVNKILRFNKSKGKVAYGGINTLTDSSKAYILIYSANDRIIALLDKGEGAERKDLISGENKNVADLYKEKGNMRVWFQLF